MLETLLAVGLIARPNPIIELEPKETETVQVEEKPKELSLEEKIAANHFNCNESTHWIRADDATCLAKPLPAIQTNNTTPVVRKAARQARGSSQGNSYTACNCTFYAKQRRPDLPNNLGNANTWYARAQAQGYSVGYEPVAGAIGEATTGYMHVVYIESVDGDMVNLSEWNFAGPCELTYRTVHKSNFRYIY